MSKGRLATRNVNDVIERKSTFGDRLSDTIASGMGSWRFIIVQSSIVIIWILLNCIALVSHWDPFPFILLNLLFSTQAAYTAPVIMMSQNRQASKDRLEAELDFETNRKAEVEIMKLHERLDDAKFERIHDHLEEIKAALGLPFTAE